MTSQQPQSPEPDAQAVEAVAKALHKVCFDSGCDDRPLEQDKQSYYYRHEARRLLKTLHDLGYLSPEQRKAAGWVQLGDMEVVSNWLETRKKPLKVSIRLDGNEVKVSTDHDEALRYYLTSFCMSLRKGELAP